jgi:hypothetical protein
MIKEHALNLLLVQLKHLYANAWITIGWQTLWPSVRVRGAPFDYGSGTIAQTFNAIIIRNEPLSITMLLRANNR